MQISLPPEILKAYETTLNATQHLQPRETVSYLIFVIDGWGNRGVLINERYIEGALYLR